jgi:hypothetical protein
VTEPLNTPPLDDSVLDQANEADAQEQALAATEGDDSAPVTTSAEVDDFDAAEQGRVVELDQEEYR